MTQVNIGLSNQVKYQFSNVHVIFSSLSVAEACTQKMRKRLKYLQSENRLIKDKHVRM
jgi:hypothetical protein